LDVKEYFSCSRKICHLDFWSAHLHWRGLTRLNEYADIEIYACDYCGGLHVGNQLTVLQAVRSLRKLDYMMKHPNFEVKTPEDIKEELKAKRERMRNFIKIETERGRGVRE